MELSEALVDHLEIIVFINNTGLKLNWQTKRWEYVYWGQNPYEPDTWVRMANYPDFETIQEALKHVQTERLYDAG